MAFKLGNITFYLIKLEAIGDIHISTEVNDCIYFQLCYYFMKKILGYLYIFIKANTETVI